MSITISIPLDGCQQRQKVQLDLSAPGMKDIICTALWGKTAKELAKEIVQEMEGENESKQRAVE